MTGNGRKISAEINKIALGESYSQGALLAGVSSLRGLEAHIHARGPVVGVELRSVVDAIDACERVAGGAVASHFDLQGAALLIARWEYVYAQELDRDRAQKALPATEDPAFKAQIAALQEVTASLNAAFELSRGVCGDVPHAMRLAGQYLQFKKDHAARIGALAAEIGDPADDVLWDLVDEMKGVLASSAANESADDAGDQESAIAAAESWVAENCSSGDVGEVVAMALWLRGDEEGEAFLRSQDAADCAPAPRN